MLNKLRRIIWIPLFFLNLTDGHVSMTSDNLVRDKSLSRILMTAHGSIDEPAIVEILQDGISHRRDNKLSSFELNRIRRSVGISEDGLKPETRDVKSLSQMANGDITANDVQEEQSVRDQIHVVSSAIRVLNKNKDRTRQGRSYEDDDQMIRSKRDELHWRKPRTQFVTRTERMSPRYQYSSELPDRYVSDNEIAAPSYNYRRTNLPQRRIIYYATLPEIVRPPASLNNEWPPQQQQQLQQRPQFQRVQLQKFEPALNLPSRQAEPQDNRPYNYPLIRDNEVTRVQSSVIDVTSSIREPPALPSQSPSIYSSISSIAPVQSVPKYTIIDADPYSRPSYFENYPYNIRHSEPYYIDRYPNNNRYNYDNRNYYDDIRTPPYRIQQSFQPPYYTKPQYIPVELPQSSSTDSTTSPFQNNISETNLIQINNKNTTDIASNENNDKHNKVENNNNNIRDTSNSRYL